MKRIGKALAMVLMIIGMTGCDDVQEVSAAEFQAMLARNPETMRHTEFVGVKDGKAYLKVSTMSTLNQKKWKGEYFVTDAGQLPEEWLAKQKAAEEDEE